MTKNLKEFTDPDASANLAYAIYRRYFGSPISEQIALEIGKNIHVFLSEKRSHGYIKKAMEEGLLKTPFSNELTSKIAENLLVLVTTISKEYLVNF